MNEITTYKYKIVLAGPPAVGKTSLMYRFVQNKFEENYALTIGVHVLTKRLEFVEDVVELIVWDIGGQARFKGLRKDFYYGTKGVLVIFDLTREQTFREMDNWLSEIFEVLNVDFPFVIIGNKNDIIKEQGRIINPNEVEAYVKIKESIYIETSAKSGENVEESFKELAHLIAKKDGRTIT